MGSEKYAVLIRMPSGVIEALTGDDGVATFGSREEAESLMCGHVLGDCPYQVVELEI